ncbi:MAG: Rieske 2Fe-2S domain-containing protein [Myxococcales bacterium]|nr:Rieske 2Fe-2S domain-containing protein [Myxococcales bacterium]
MHGHDGSDQGSSSRRGALKLGVGLLGVGLAAIPAVPAIGFLGHPLKASGGDGGKGGGFVPAGKRAGFGATPVRVDLHADRVDAWSRETDVKLGSCWVIEREGKLTALSTTCPHLGCAVDYDAAAQKFKCPCHRSAFGLDGQVEEGPSPRPMDTLELEEKEGLVAIRFQRFKTGVAAKEPV